MRFNQLQVSALIETCTMQKQYT